jgi:putative transposase
MLTLSYEFKLKPTCRQIHAIESWLEICRQVWNDGLRERKDWVKSRKSPVNACSLVSEYIIPADAPRPTYASQCKALTQAKKDYPQLKIPQSQVLQQTLKSLETAWVAMYRRGFGFPRFKKKGRFRSFVFPKVKETCIEGNQIDLPKIGKVRFFKSRSLPEGFVVKQVRVLKRASGYYIILSLQADVEVPQPPISGHAIGLDVGWESYLATSDGELIDNPRLFVKASGKLKWLQQKLKRKQKGSRRWRLIQHRIAKLYEHLASARKDFFFKLAHHLCDVADSIFAEALNLKVLGQGPLAKYCLDAAWGEFLSILSWVCLKRGKYFAKVDAKQTSQICPHCGVHTGKKPLSQRTHSCSHCGYQTHRDVAAAQVVLNRGVESTSGQGGRMLVEGNVAGDGLA